MHRYNSAHRRSALVIVVLVALLATTPVQSLPAHASSRLELGSVNTFHAAQTGYLDVEIPEDVVFRRGFETGTDGVRNVGSFGISGSEEGHIAGFYLLGTSVAASAYAHTLPIVTDNFGSMGVVSTGAGDESAACSGGRCDLPAGDYRLYLITPDVPVTITLTLDGLSGTTDTDTVDSGIITPVAAQQHVVMLDDQEAIDAATAAGYWGVAANAVLPSRGVVIQTATMESSRHKDPSGTLTRPAAATYRYCAYGATPPQAVLPGCPGGVNQDMAHGATPSGSASFVGTRSFTLEGRPTPEYLGFYGANAGQNVLSASNGVLALPFD